MRRKILYAPHETHIHTHKHFTLSCYSQSAALRVIVIVYTMSTVYSLNLIKKFKKIV